MSQTKIEWATDVWNPVTGCTKVSPGCKNCYAERMSKRLRGRYGYPADDSFKVTLHPGRLDEPLRWRKPRRVFVCSMGDLFHDDVGIDFIAHVFAVAAVSQWHTFLVLTKRPERMRRLLSDESFEFDVCVYADMFQNRAEEMDPRFDPNHRTSTDIRATLPDKLPLPNVWLGVSCENQHTADDRIPVLLQTQAAKRFVSLEPLLAGVDLTNLPYQDGDVRLHWNALTGEAEVSDSVSPCAVTDDNPRLDWVIVGGESGPGRRECRVEWVRSIRDQCVAASVPLFLKQLHVDGKKVATPELDGRAWTEFPQC